MFTWKCVFYPHFWKLVCWILDFLINGFCFGFLACSILNVSCLCLLAFKISDDKSAINLIGVPFYVRSYFFLAAFKIFSCNTFYLIGQSVGISSSILLRICWNSWMEFAHQIWEVFTFYLFIWMFFCSFLSFLYSHPLGWCRWRFVSFLFIFLRLLNLVFFRLHNFPSSLLKFAVTFLFQLKCTAESLKSSLYFSNCAIQL